MKTESNVVQTNIGQSGKKVFEVGDCKMEDLGYILFKPGSHEETFQDMHGEILLQGNDF